MNRDRWQQVKQICEAALKLAPESREEFLRKSCGEDQELRDEVESLLSFSDSSESFLETPAVEEIAEIIVERSEKIKKGARFAHYEIIEQIGTGGMGEVYLAEDKTLDRRVAVKILNEQFRRHKSNLERFLREAKSASALNHPNILVIHEVGESENSNYIVSEYIEGKTLREILRESPLDLREVLDIAIQIAGALVAAHSAKIVHRDIKPENVMIRPDGFVKVLDFGLAKLVEQTPFGLEESATRQNQTAKGVILGTVQYMSPEQAKGEPVDERTDIFSLGAVVYEMLAGRTPFQSETVSETFANLINQEPPPLVSMPDKLQGLVTKMLRKNKAARYQTMNDVLTDLKILQRRLDFEAELQRAAPQFKQADITTQPLEIDTGESRKTTGEIKSIAVLPFTNMSADAENEYFCDGLAEELLNALAKIENLRVAARTSAFSFKGRNLEVSEIGRILNVNTILEGSVRRSGNRLRITVQLVNAADGFHLWSERYDGELKDIFDLQDEITLAVIDGLKIKLLSGEKAALRHRYAENVEAYQLYLKGRYHFLKLTPWDTEKGIEYLHQAIALDPNYAPAYAGLAAAYVTFPLTCDSPSDEFFPKAKEAARKALEIDERLSQTYSALFWATLWYDWDWDECERQCLRAIELSPNDADAHEANAHFLSNVGRHAEGLAEIKLARELDPLHLRINALEGQFLLHAGKPDEALERLEKTLELEPRFWLAHLFVSSCYIEKGMYGEAIDAAQKARRFSGISTHPIAFGGYAQAKSGNKAEARKMLQELLDLSAEKYVPPPNIAMIYNGLGETGEALRWLERGFKERDARVAFLKVEPKWNNLRDDPRFIDLLARVGFPADEKKDKTTGEAKKETLESAIRTDSFVQPHTRESFVTGSLQSRSRIFTFGLIAILLAAVGFGYYFLVARKTSSGDKKSLAVLPFVNTSRDPNAEYLSDGITESVINNLSQISGLKVMSKNSTFRFRDNQADIKNIASQLGVKNIVTGDIKQIGDQLIINVRLINATDDSQIWGNQYVKTPSDIIVTQNEIARDVSRNLGARLSIADERKLAKNYTDNPEAYQLFLKGRYYVEKYNPLDGRKALDYLQQAVALDPNFAVAYANISGVYVGLAGTKDFPRRETVLKAKEFSLKAISLDDQLSTPHDALGNLLYRYEYDFVGAEREFKRALELDPNDTSAHESYGGMLIFLGRHEEALAEMRLAAEINPLSPTLVASVGNYFLHVRRYDEAVAEYKKALELDANFIAAHNGLSITYQMQRKYAESVEERAKLTEILVGKVGAEFIRQSFAKGGWQGFLREMTRNPQAPPVPPYVKAAMYAELGEKDKAFEILNQLYEDHSSSIVILNVDPRFDALRDDPRFQDLLRRIGLP